MENGLVYWSFFLLMLSSPAVSAQNGPLPEYQVKAAFLFNFTQFVKWPESAFASQNAPFVIGIMGNDPFGQYLQEIVRNERVGDHPIQVQHFSEGQSVNSVHILFCNIPHGMPVKPLVAELSPHPVLTISEHSDFAQSGGMIQFYVVNNKVKLMVNPESAKAAGLVISSKLLRVAEIIQTSK